MKTESWSSTRGFLMATVGAAVGLGNLWRFPYIAGSNGGSAFVLVYVGWVLLLGLPLVIGELALGRRGGLNAVHTMREVALSEGRSGAWVAIGWAVDPGSSAGNYLLQHRGGLVAELHAAGCARNGSGGSPQKGRRSFLVRCWRRRCG